jgi:hypothetical protein
MISKHLRRNFTDFRSLIEMEGILTFNCHDITLTHFEFNETVN